MTISRKMMPTDLGSSKTPANAPAMDGNKVSPPSFLDKSIISEMTLRSLCEVPKKPIKKGLAPQASPASLKNSTPNENSSWGIITEDLKHSANLWDILEVRATEKPDSGIQEVRNEIEKIKGILEQHNF